MNWKIILSLGLIILLVTIINIVYVVYHEDIHKTICEKFKGEAKIKYNLLSYSTTSCIGMDMEMKIPDFTKYNLINEFIGYYFMIFLSFLMIYPIYLKLINYWLKQ